MTTTVPEADWPYVVEQLPAVRAQDASEKEPDPPVCDQATLPVGLAALLLTVEVQLVVETLAPRTGLVQATETLDIAACRVTVTETACPAVAVNGEAVAPVPKPVAVADAE